MVATMPTDRQIQLGKRLRQARVAVELRQEQVAEAIGSHAVTISKYERGVQDPNTDLLREMSRLYGVSVDWVLSGDNPGEGDDDPGQQSIEADRDLVMNEASLALRSTSKDLSDEAIKSIADYIRFVHAREERERRERQERG